MSDGRPKGRRPSVYAFRSMGENVSISQALQQAVTVLQEARVAEPRLTAEVLLAAILACDRSFLYAHGDEALEPAQAARYQADLERRCAGSPTQYITGIQEFYGLPFHVEPGVLIPRPETELLVEKALERTSAGDRILDIGTGSGAIAIAIQKQLPEAKVFASDVSRTALSIAAENAHKLGVSITLVQADLSDAFGSGALHMAICNPPYVSVSDYASLQREVRDHEPRVALVGGEDGLEPYRRLSTTACDVLRPSGWLLMEVGYNTSAAVKPMFHGPRWEEPTLYRDLAGWERVLAVRRTATE